MQCVTPVTPDYRRFLSISEASDMDVPFAWWLHKKLANGSGNQAEAENNQEIGNISFEIPDQTTFSLLFPIIIFLFLRIIIDSALLPRSYFKRRTGLQNAHFY